MITKLNFFDMDGCLIDSQMPETGKVIWKEKTGTDYPHIGWWSKPESLDFNVFDIKPFSNVLNILKKETSNQNSFVVILTSRMEKLRPYVENLLNHFNIHVDKLDMKYNYRTKGQKVLEYIEQFPNLVEVNVYDDQDINIDSYKLIRNQIPENIKFNIYLTTEGNLSLVESNNSNILSVINEEIKDFIADKNYVYHGTNDGAGYHIQLNGGMKINAANNNEPFISFTSKPEVAKYYADMT